MRTIGVMDDAEYEKIALRHLEGVNAAPMAMPMTAEDIRASARMSQAVVARALILPVGYVSQLERGAACGLVAASQ